MNEEDVNKYDGVVPQTIEASGNLLKNSDSKFILILAIICSLTFLGYTVIEKVYDTAYCQIK
jgi:hypothetical protein